MSCQCRVQGCDDEMALLRSIYRHPLFPSHNHCSSLLFPRLPFCTSCLATDVCPPRDVLSPHWLKRGSQVHHSSLSNAIAVMSRSYVPPPHAVIEMRKKSQDPEEPLGERISTTCRRGRLIILGFLPIVAIVLSGRYLNIDHILLDANDGAVLVLTGCMSTAPGVPSMFVVKMDVSKLCVAYFGMFQIAATRARLFY
jgi:hypothetical protein